MSGLTCLMFLAVVSVVGGVTLKHVHHDNKAMETYLQEVAAAYPKITSLYSIGTSINGWDLWVMKIGSNNSQELRPHVKYIGNMHGNEVVSREILLHLIQYYVTSYEVNSTITNFLNTTVVHIMPSMNPDGYAMAREGDCHSVLGRANAEDIDLNRNFPDVLHGSDLIHVPTREVQLVMDWLEQSHFVLSANLHGGAMVANYPYDQYLDPQNPRNSGPSRSPDDEMFRFLALTYTRSHKTMAIDNGRECGDYFPEGITNGAAWYTISGGMQDYNYIAHGVFEILIEVSCCKYPTASRLPILWLDNKQALINYLMEAHRGVKGIIRDENSNPIKGAKLTILGRESVPFKTSSDGEYFRLLVPGTYTLQVSADKYAPMSRSFVVKEGTVTRLDLNLASNEINASNSFLSGQSYLLLFIAQVLFCL